MSHRRLILLSTIAGALLSQSARVATLSASGHSQTSGGRPFHWNWHKSQELNSEQSLKNAKMPVMQRKAISDAIATHLHHFSDDLELDSEGDFTQAALATRIKMIDLNDDGVPEVVAQSMVGCGASGNCMFWVFRKSRSGYELVLDGTAQMFTIQESVTNGFHDIVLSRHGSYSSGDLTPFRYAKSSYRTVGCYEYNWTVLEGENVRELKEPKITPCKYPSS